MKLTVELPPVGGAAAAAAGAVAAVVAEPLAPLGPERQDASRSVVSGLLSKIMMNSIDIYAQKFVAVMACAVCAR